MNGSSAYFKDAGEEGCYSWLNGSSVYFKDWGRMVVEGEYVREEESGRRVIVMQNRVLIL